MFNASYENFGVFSLSRNFRHVFACAKTTKRRRTAATTSVDHVIVTSLLSASIVVPRVVQVTVLLLCCYFVVYTVKDLPNILVAHSLFIYLYILGIFNLPSTWHIAVIYLRFRDLSALTS